MARCCSCSAPLSKYRSECEYCGTANDIDLQQVHEFTTSKPESQRMCPHCDRPLTTIDLTLDGHFYIERCEQCLGLFFDPGELQCLLDKTVTNVYTINYQKLAAFTFDIKRRESLVQYIKCPICAELMNRINFGSLSGVIIDRCGSHGVWLDSGELKQLLDWKKAGGQLLHEKRDVEKKEADLKGKDRKAQEHRQYIARECSHNAAGNMVFTSSYATFGFFDLISRIISFIFK